MSIQYLFLTRYPTICYALVEHLFVNTEEYYMAKRKNKKPKPPTTQSPNQTDRIKTAHNNFFEYVFSDLNHAREFLAVYGPSDVIGNLKLDDLDFQKDDFMDEHLRSNRTDVFYEAPLITTQSSAPAHIYILFEHKSASESLNIQTGSSATLPL